MNNYNFNEDKPKKNIVVAVLFVIFFLGSMIAIVVFAKTNMPVSVMIFGLLLLVFGLITVFNTKLTLSNAFILLFPLIGIGISSIAGFIAWGSESIKEKTMQNIPLMLLAVFFLMGVLFIISGAGDIIHKKRVCTVLVTSICTNIKSRISSSRDHASHTVYCPEFTYYYNGIEYTSSEDAYSNANVPNLNDEEEIYINPDNPSEFTRKSYLSQIAYIVAGIFFVILSSASSYLCFFNK